MNPGSGGGRRSLRERACLTALACTTMLAAGALAVPGAMAEEPVIEPRASHNLFGMTGLIDMPSAEMQPDGQLTMTVGYHGGGFLRTTLAAQILTGVEGAFRYSVIDDTLGTPDDPQTLYDRSFDLKVRLIDEAPNWPAVAVGLQDFLGTGVYSGEYVAMTKNFLDGDLKVTGGFGWGRFAGEATIENPLARISDRFRDRDTPDGVGGEVNFGRFFQGEDMGFFGGLEYLTPVDGLSLKAEFSSDTYDAESARGTYEHEVPVNLGLEYKPWPGISVGAYYLYGTDFGLRVSFSGNPYRPLAKNDVEPGPLPLQPRPAADATAASALLGTVREFLTGAGPKVTVAESGVAGVEVEERDGLRWATASLPPSADFDCPDEAALAIDAEYGVIDAVTFVHAGGRVICTVALRPAGEAAIAEAARASTGYPTGWHDDPETLAKIAEALETLLEPDRIGLLGLDIGPRRVEVYVENAKFRETPRAIGRVARALSRVMPPSVEVFRVVPVERGLPVVSVTLDRSDLEAQAERPGADRASWLAASVGDAPPADWSAVTGVTEQFPRLSWSLDPSIPLNLFDPDQPVRFDVALKGTASLELAPGLSLSGTVRKRLVGDLDEIERESDSELPRVRSDIAEYLSEGDPALSRLTADWLTKLDHDLYGRVSVGFLELMHAGVSGEVLWKPVDQSWGLGAEINWSKQRDFDALFGFRNHEVVTGHASLYWDTGWHGMTAQIDAGRYLARDWGGTVTVKRRFANGWEVGGFFTLTDVPFDEFGEGSFDKGLILTIPFNWMLPYESRSELGLTIRPLTRDGGQRLDVANRLYPIVEDFDRHALRRDWGGFWE